MRLRKRRHRSRAAVSSKKYRLVMSCIETFLKAGRPAAESSGLDRLKPSAPELALPCGRSSKGLLNDGPVVIARVAGLLEQPDPAVRVGVELGGQDPFLEQRLLFRRPIGIDLNKPLPRRQALDFTESGDQFVPFQIMDRIERDDGIEAAIRERQF